MSALDGELDVAPEAAAPADAGDRAGWGGAQVYALALLTLIAMFNYLDRNLLGMVLPLVKAEMQLSDTVLGLVTGLVFVLFYSLLGIPIASLADRSNRRNIIAAGFGFWSLMTVLTGFAANVWQLAAARFLMGAGEACSLAPSNSMISDLFGKHRRALALAILTSSFALQSILFAPPIGWISDHWGWRAVFITAGVPGMLVSALFFFTVPEPRREATARAADETVSMAAAIRFLLGSKAFLFMVVGCAFMGGAIYAAGAWVTTFLVRVHHLSLTYIGAAISPARGVVGFVGIILAGVIADRLGRKDGRWRVWAPAAFSLLLAPAQVLFSLGQSSVAWIGGLMLLSFLLTAYQGPIYAAAMNVARPRMRAVAISIIAFTTGILGQVVGPVLVGFLNDSLAPAYGDEAIRYSMLVIAGCGLLGGLSFVGAAWFLDADTRRAAEA
jgi:MFS family permease